MNNDSRLSEDKNKQAKSLLQDAFQTVAGVIAVCYALGFVIINAFLVTIGVTSITLLNSKYLSAGICFLFFYGLAAFLIGVVHGRQDVVEEWEYMVGMRNKRLAEEEEANAPGYRPGYTFGYTVAYASVYVIKVAYQQIPNYIVFALTCGLLLWMTGSDLRIIFTYQTVGWMAVWILTATLVIAIARGVWGVGPIRSAPLLPWLLVLATASTLVYGAHIYPKLSPSIGGGLPVAVTLVVSDDKKAAVESLLGAPLSSNKTVPLHVLLETSDTLIVSLGSPDNPRICQISKTLISGLIYDR